MRRALLALLFLSVASTLSLAQTRAFGTWESVKALPSGVSIHVKSDHVGTKTCRFEKVDDDHLFCLGGIDSTTELTYPRAAISSVKLVRRGRSAWAGFGIGFAGGAAVVGGIARGLGADGYIGAAAVGGGLVYGGIGAAIGAGTDFARGPEIYRRP